MRREYYVDLPQYNTRCPRIDWPVLFIKYNLAKLWFFSFLFCSSLKLAALGYISRVAVVPTYPGLLSSGVRSLRNISGGVFCSAFVALSILSLYMFGQARASYVLSRHDRESVSAECSRGRVKRKRKRKEKKTTTVMSRRTATCLGTTGGGLQPRI